MSLAALARTLEAEALKWARAEFGPAAMPLSSGVHGVGSRGAVARERDLPIAAFRFSLPEPAVGVREYTVTIAETTIQP